MKRFFFILLLISMLSLSAFAQAKVSTSVQTVKSSSAYAEILLRKTELEAEAESLSESYTEDFPKMKETRYELGLIQKDLEKISTQTDVSRLTLALGKMMVKRATLNTDLWVLQNKLGAEHPDVKRAQRKVLSFDKAVSEILP